MCGNLLRARTVLVLSLVFRGCWKSASWLWAKKKKLIYSMGGHKRRDTKERYSRLSPRRINAPICRGYFSSVPLHGLAKIWGYVCHSCDDDRDSVRICDERARWIEQRRGTRQTELSAECPARRERRRRRREMTREAKGS